MEWTDMRESFYAVLLLNLLIRRSRRNLHRVGPLQGPATFLEHQDARVRLRYPSWTDRLAESSGAHVT